MTIEELDELAASNGMDEFIRVCEARQVKALSKIADAIVARPGVKVVLLAGGSSAGKTTTAKRLCTQLRVNGAEALHFSTDDYFVGDERNPRNPDGSFDYEHVDCVDRDRLAADLNALAGGESIRPRRFDFTKRAGYDAAETVSLPESGYVVLEGIHALNPLLMRGVDDARKFRVFIDPRPKIEIFGKTMLPASDSRLLRRIVRDNQFRRIDPSHTLAMWDSVLAGERRWILPFAGNADATFDSMLEYELTVLKPYALGLLARVLLSDPRNGRAHGLAEMLSAVRAVSPNAVPGDSILRETIGGSQLSY